MKKSVLKFLSFVIVALFLLNIAPQAAQALTSGNYTYTVSAPGATITQYTGNGGKVIIPSTLGGSKVIIIGMYSFYGCTSVTSVYIPSSVTTIQYGAFEFCTRLTSVYISNSATIIGFNAFYGCVGLKGMTIPNNAYIFW